MTIRRLGYALGAEVTGVDLRRPLDEATIAELRQAWLTHIVLSFPGQGLSPEQYMRFCRSFGPLRDNVRSENVHPEIREVTLLSSVPVAVAGKPIARSIAGVMWHSDLDTNVAPGTATFLLAEKLPDIGGNTLFANTYAAYETLSDGMRRLLDPLSAVYDIAKSVSYVERSPEEKERVRRQNPPVVHPVVRVHPETGRKALHVGRRLRNFVGMTEEETAPILEFLNEHAVRYEFVLRYAWKPGDLVMWDNRCSMHYAVQDFDQSRERYMLRCVSLPPETGYECEDLEDAGTARAVKQVAVSG